MSQPKLDTANDYHVPLLRLMTELPAGQGSADDVSDLFFERYQDDIPNHHMATLADGKTSRWYKWVAWARYVLIQAGLMDSPRRGIWRITPAGRAWLTENPDALRIGNSVDHGRSANHHDRRREHAAVERQNGAPKIPVPDQTHTRQGTKSIPRRNQFLRGFGDKLAELLPSSSEQLAVAFESDRSWIKIKSRSFPGSHYELGLHRDCHEIAIHFESSLKSSMRRLDVFIPLVEELSPRLGQQLRAERWGENWARLYFELPVAELTESLEARYAQQMAQFIELTLPAMRQAYAGQHRRRRRPAGPDLHVSERPHENSGAGDHDDPHFLEGPVGLSPQ